MMNNTLEELTRDQLQEELHVHNQPVGGSKEQLKERLTKYLEEDGLDPATEVFEVEDARSMVDPLTQILEKLSAAKYHLTHLTAKANQQEEHLASITATANQQFTELRQAHHEQITELRQEIIKTISEQIPKEVQQQVALCNKSWKHRKQSWRTKKNQKTTLEKLEEWLSKVETRSQTIINQISDGTRRQRWWLGNQAPSKSQPLMELVCGSCTTSNLKLQLSTTDGLRWKRW